MKNIKTGVYTYNDESYNFEFATDLSVYEKTIFVRTVVDTLVDDTAYDSILRDIIFDYTIISMFTDVDTSFLKIVDDNGNVVTNIDLLEQFLEETNIVEIVKVNAFPTLFNELNKAVDKSIEYRTGIHPSPIADSLASLLSTLEKKINEIDLGSAMSMVEKFAGMTSELTLESIMNAYMNSDIHKGNLEEITKAKAERTKIVENLGKAIKEVNEENKSKKKSTKKTTKSESKAEDEVESKEKVED